MSITPEESEAYNAALRWADCDAYNTVNKAVYLSLILALRRHVAAEMRLEFEKEHEVDYEEDRHGQMTVPHCWECGGEEDFDPRHKFQLADWDRAADKALRGGKSDE